MSQNKWYERFGYNPLVLRAFRTGFRSGRGNFRIGIWCLLLLLALAVPALMVLAAAQATGEVDWELAASTTGRALIFFFSALLVFGGIQRMLSSISGERERGTFDFLHLSTLPPRAILWGGSGRRRSLWPT